MLKNKLFNIAYSIILILIIIFFLGQIDYIILPLKAVFSLVFTPVFIGGFLYYLLRPMVRFLTAKTNHKLIAILVTFFTIIGIIIFVIYFGGNIIKSEVENLIRIFSNYYDILKTKQVDTMFWEEEIQAIFNEFKIQEKLASFAENMIKEARNNAAGLFSTLTDIGTLLVLIPFVLFYFLKDEEEVYQGILTIIPKNMRERVKHMLKDIDDALATYISGQLIVAIILGALSLIGYLIIGLPNAFILAFITMITSFIPFLGPILGILPALLIGITTDFFLVIKVLIVMVVVQQLEGNIISPKIQGDRMNIHPLIVIFLVLIFITLFGFLGALFAVPVYAVLRVIIKDFIESSDH